MTKLLQDILNQPRELIRSLHHNLGPGRGELEKAAGLIRGAQHTFVTGIGSSWHAGMAVQSFLQAKGQPATLVDASELLYHVEFPPNAVLIALSRRSSARARSSAVRMRGSIHMPILVPRVIISCGP